MVVKAIYVGLLNWLTVVIRCIVWWIAKQVSAIYLIENNLYYLGA